MRASAHFSGPVTPIADPECCTRARMAGRRAAGDGRDVASDGALLCRGLRERLVRHLGLDVGAWTDCPPLRYACTSAAAPQRGRQGIDQTRTSWEAVARSQQLSRARRRCSPPTTGSPVCAGAALPSKAPLPVAPGCARTVTADRSGWVPASRAHSSSDTLLLVGGGIGSQSLQGIAIVQLTGSTFAVKQSSMIALGSPIADMEVLASSPWFNGASVLHALVLAVPSPQMLTQVARFMLRRAAASGASDPLAVFALVPGGGLAVYDIKQQSCVLRALLSDVALQTC